jgi:PhoH-like ATPase
MPRCSRSPDEDAVLVTKDAALRIKGAQLGLEVQDYRADTVPVDELHSGVTEVQVESTLIDKVYAENKVTLEDNEVICFVNQFLVLRNGSQSALVRVIESNPLMVVERVSNHLRVFGVEPKNLRQNVALHLLMDPDIAAVSIMGMAGTGKTFLALAAALEQVLEMGRYRRVTVYRPLVAVGRQEVGFLPGDLSEKLAP